MSDAERPTLYLKFNCPYSLKLHIFLTEAGLRDRFRIVIFDDGDTTHVSTREAMRGQGIDPTYPAELKAGRYRTGSDELIEVYAGEARVDPGGLPLLQHYLGGVFPRHLELEKENAALKKKGA